MQITKKIISTVLLFFIISLPIKAEKNLGATFFKKSDRLINAPSNDDPRIIILYGFGGVLTFAGAYLLIKGGIKLINGRERNEMNSQENIPNQIIADLVARLSGLGTSLIGIMTTAGGFATLIGAKEAIYQFEKYMNKNC